MSNEPLPFKSLRANPVAEAELRPDIELVAAVIQGDSRVAAELHDRLVAVVDQTLVRILGRREHDHDDLMQSAFEQIVRSLVDGNFLGACSLRTWANRITTHVALNAIRSRQRERRVIERPSQPAEQLGASTHPRTEAEVELSRLRRHLVEISLGSAEMLVLHDLYGHSLAEIAALLGISEAAAQSRLVRGRKELQKRLSRERRGSGASGVSS